MVGGIDGLLREVRRLASGSSEPGAGGILEWLHRQTGAQVGLIAEDDIGTLESSTAGFPREILPPLAPLLARLSGGQVAAAATRAGAWHVHGEALDAHDARLVLVTAARSPLSQETVALASHTGSVLTLLRRAEDGERTWHGYRHKARQVRFAVFSALLAGDVTLARRMTTGGVPPLLETDRLRIHLLHCPPPQRARVERAFQDPSGYHGADLMVECPIFHEHLICLVAEGQAGGHGEALRRLARDTPGYALGISGPHPLSATASAYSQAAHALAAARATSNRVVSHQGHTDLERVLPRGPALAWARSVVRPLVPLSPLTADVTRMLMAVPRGAVSQLLNMSRNTVTAHIRRAEQSLDLDLADVRSRATLHLAFVLSASAAGPEPDEPRTPPALDDLLRGERPVAWARTFLRPLPAPQRTTLEAWIDANTDAQEAARRIGINRNTVRAHLRTAEAVLGRDLLTTGVGLHDIVHALRIHAARGL
ncbi:helix-turn-helix domain-containing protein [Streptomyces mayteni]